MAGGIVNKENDRSLLSHFPFPILWTVALLRIYNGVFIFLNVCNCPLDTPCCLASLRWLSPFCMCSRTSLFCRKLGSVCNFRLAIYSLMQVQYSTMYCITTNTLWTTENNVRYSALTSWFIYHVFWFRNLNFCLFCWLVNFLLLQLCMYSTFHQWTLYILEGEWPYNLSMRKQSSETRHNDLLHLTGLKYYHGQYGQVYTVPRLHFSWQTKTGIQHIKVEKLWRWSYMQII